MSEYLSKKITKVKFLNPGESLEVNFNVPNPGRILAIAKADWDKIFPPDPTKRLVELFAPGATSATVKVLDEGTAKVTFLNSNATSSNTGVWKARITNKEDSREKFTLTVSYPGTVELKTLTVPISIINSFINATIKQVVIHLTDGTNNSYIRFPTSMGVPDSRFTIPKYTRKINMPWPVPDITISERVSNIDSKTVSANLVNAGGDYINGAINLKINFETSGYEIKGTVDANISKMNLDVMLGITVANQKITYQTNNIGVNFPISVDLVNVPDFLEGFINGLTGFRDSIKTSMKNSARNAFISSATRQAITNALNSQISTVLGAGAKVFSAKVQGGNLIVKYYN